MAGSSKSRKSKTPPPPKGGRRPGAGSHATTSGRVTPKSSGRYTPPIPIEVKVSPKWVPVLMFTLLIAGMIIIVSNYLEVLPGDAKNTYLFLGLGCITAGFITATKYR